MRGYLPPCPTRRGNFGSLTFCPLTWKKGCAVDRRCPKISVKKSLVWRRGCSSRRGGSVILQGQEGVVVGLIPVVRPRKLGVAQIPTLPNTTSSQWIFNITFQPFIRRHEDFKAYFRVPESFQSQNSPTIRRRFLS